MWIGLERKYVVPIMKVLREGGLTEDQIIRVMTTFRRRAYPGGFMRVKSMVVGPPPSPIHAGAYREHNFGSEKDLEASVVWRAHLTLSSAVRSFEIANLELGLEDLPAEIEMAPKFGRDVVREAIDHLLIPLSRVDIYHPIVVLEAPLWTMENEQPKQVEWCRFHRLTAWGHSDWWFDLVSADSFATYARRLTDHYASAFRRVKARLT
jgi:hypothetical protein